MNHETERELLDLIESEIYDEMMTTGEGSEVYRTPEYDHAVEVEKAARHIKEYPAIDIRYSLWIKIAAHAVICMLTMRIQNIINRGDDE